MSLAATRELAEAVGVEPLALLRANRDRPWLVESGALAFETLRPGDVLRHPEGGEIEIVSMAGLRVDAAARALLGSVSGDFQASVQSRINSLGSQSAAALQSTTGVDVTQARVSTGAAAAASLASNGYDPSSTADNDKLVLAIAGGTALIPVVGPAAAAAVEALYQVGKVVACPLEQAFASIGLSTLPPSCGGSPCQHTGADATAASVLASNSGDLPSHDPTSFGALVLGALATGAASALNCRGAVPPGVIVDAVVLIWNQTHSGPTAAYLVPPLNEINQGSMAFGSPSLITTWGGAGGSANTPATRAHQDPYVFYAFFPVGTTTPDHPSGGLPTAAGPWTPWSVARPPPGQNVDPPRVVMVNTGPLLPPATMTIPGAPAQATQFQSGHTYVVSQTVSGADTNTGAPLAGESVMSEQDYLTFMPALGFSPAQILWWGPTSSTDDPAGYLASGWLGTIFGLGMALHALGGKLFMLATYGGQNVLPVPADVTAFDVTGTMTPRQTVLSAPGLSTGAKVALGAGAAAAAGGGLWLWLGRPLTIASIESAFGRLLDRL